MEFSPDLWDGCCVRTRRRTRRRKCARPRPRAGLSTMPSASAPRFRKVQPQTRRNAPAPLLSGHTDDVETSVDGRQGTPTPSRLPEATRAGFGRESLHMPGDLQTLTSRLGAACIFGTAPLCQSSSGICQPPTEASTRFALAKAMSSRQGRAANWTFIGSPSGEVPARTTTAGHPVRL